MSRNDCFPSTHWSRVAAAGDSLNPEHVTALNCLIERYGRPVYWYVRRRGFNHHDASDLTDEFFVRWLAKKLFGRADPERGRFRAYLITSLKNFLRNAHRDAATKGPRAPARLLSLDQLTNDDEWDTFEPEERETPEDVFNRAWASELVLRVLRLLQQECRITSKEAHYVLLKDRVVEPALHGSRPTPMAELARRFHLTEKQVANRLLTARRAYQRILREEIMAYAASEDDLAGEVQDLFTFLSSP